MGPGRRRPLDDSTAAQPSFTYTTGGVYTVTLEVTDPGGASDTDTVTINAGSGPPTASIDSPAAGTTWRVGQTITFSGSATDPDEGPLPASALDWSLILHHCSTPTECHEHGIQDYANTAGGSFAAPDHEYPSYIELRLTATDSNGNTDVKTLRLDPQTSTITVNTSPAGMDVTVGEETGPGPIQHEAIVGSSNTLTASSPQAFNNRSYIFYAWSNGQAQTHTLTAPATDTTYTASYVPIAPGTHTLTFSPEADAYVEEANPNTNFGAATFLRTDAGGNPDVDSYLRFQLTGIQGRITSAKLRLFSTSNTIDGPAVMPTSNSWSEIGDHLEQQAGRDGQRSGRCAGNLDRHLGRMGRRARRHRARAGQLPAAPGDQRRRELPLPRLHQHDPQAGTRRDRCERRV